MNTIERRPCAGLKVLITSSEAEKLAAFGANRAPQNAPIGFVCAAAKEHARLVRGELRDNHLEMPNGRGCKINFLLPEAKGGPSFYYVTRLPGKRQRGRCPCSAAAAFSSLYTCQKGAFGIRDAAVQMLGIPTGYFF